MYTKSFGDELVFSETEPTFGRCSLSPPHFGRGDWIGRGIIKFQLQNQGYLPVPVKKSLWRNRDMSYAPVVELKRNIWSRSATQMLNKGGEGWGGRWGAGASAAPSPSKRATSPVGNGSIAHAAMRQQSCVTLKRDSGPGFVGEKVSDHPPALPKERSGSRWDV